MIDSLYQCTVPTAEAVIKNLESKEQSQQDQKITIWLHRYIRSCRKSELSQFIRFITGSASFSPNTTIKLEFINQPTSYLRPFSKTCLKILILPRQYISFTALRENLKFNINNTENWTVYDGVAINT